MSAPSSSDPIRLLVVDDEPDVPQLLELRFRAEVRSGAFELRFARNGSEALDVVTADERIDVVVTDLNMPGISGLELLAKLNELHRPLKTIVLTAYGDMANIRTAMMRGAFDFQVKPLDIDDLRTTIKKAGAIVHELRAGEAAARRAQELAERNAHLTDVFGKYVSDDVVQQLLAAPGGVDLRGEQREVTFLLADIRGFSRLASRIAPEQVVDVLNGYLAVAVDRIAHWGGMINEILGDGLLVFFGAPIADDAAPEHAIAAAIELQLAMGELNERHRGAGLPELAIGVGIHTGEAVLGTIGAGRRLKYTAVGASVNLVGRIESYARGGQILVSDATFQHVDDIVLETGSFAVTPKGNTSEALALHAVRGLGGQYQLELPTSHEPMHGVDFAPPTSIARVVDDRVGELGDCMLLAIGRESARLRTNTMLAPLDDVVVRLDVEELYGRVSECHLDDTGQLLVTVVFNAVAGDVVAHLIDRSSKPVQYRPRRMETARDPVRRTRPAPVDR